jgi:hypothetical protein
LGVLHLVEYHDQRRAVLGFCQVFDAGFGAPLDLGNDPLVYAAF